MTKTVRFQSYGFTLVEMLVAMTVVAVLLGISASGYLGLRTTMILRQSSENLKSDIMYAKRASMLIKRGSDENWIKGVGIDLSGLHGNQPAYRVFKWCSDDTEYEDFDFRTFAASLTYDPSQYYGDCKSIGDSELAAIAGYVKLAPSVENIGFKISPEVVSPEAGVRFILFESPTGQMRIYDCNGNEIEQDQEVPVRLIYTIGSRSYQVIMTANGEVTIDVYDGQLPATEVCGGLIDIFE